MTAIAGKILCCLCGSPIDPNAAAMCIDCLRSQYNIIDDIDKNMEIIQCRKCGRWNTKLNQWISHEMESSGLLNVCLKKINALSKKDIKILHAAWIWTEPHSRRLKISIDIERGVLDGKVNMSQRFIVEFVMIMKQCPDCARSETDHTWGAMVQIRQHTGYKRSIYYLESLLLKSGLSNTFIDVEVKKDGFDIFFSTKNQAEKVAEFISSHMPTRSKVSKKLVSHNTHTHKAKQEVTICLDIAGLAKDDLLLTSKELFGSISLVLVTKVSSVIHLLNPSSLSSAEVTTAKYFSLNPQPLLTVKQLEKFIVLNIEFLDLDYSLDHKKSHTWALAEAEVAKESDFGENDRTYHVITHLGNILQAGDLVLGYDLQHSVSNADLLATLPYQYPDVILVRKTYPQRPYTARIPKKKVNGRRKRNHQGGEAKDDVEIEIDLNDEKAALDSSDEQEGQEILEDDGVADESWLDVDDIEYELFRQQQADEEENHVSRVATIDEFEGRR